MRSLLPSEKTNEMILGDEDDSNSAAGRISFILSLVNSLENITRT